MIVHASFYAFGHNNHCHRDGSLQGFARFQAQFLQCGDAHFGSDKVSTPKAALT
jgi:hypothetical protein